MAGTRNDLILNIIKINLKEEIFEILNILKQGFDVFVKVGFEDIKSPLKAMLKQEIECHNLNICLIETWDEFVKSNSFINSEVGSVHNKNVSGKLKVSLLIGSEFHEKGYGIITYQLKTPDQLIGSVAQAVSKILRHFGLEMYLDVFDGGVLTRLKHIARSYGVLHLIDTVVQVSFFAGYQGDAAKAQEFLDNPAIQLPTSVHSNENFASLETCAKKFLSHAISLREEAHTFLKSCLSYYMINDQGHSMTRASEILQVSRTTLHEHLKIASKLGVSHFFEGSARRLDA